MANWRMIFAWPLAQIFYWAGHLIMKLDNAIAGESFSLYRPYNWLMLRSFGLSEWGNLKLRQSPPPETKE
jgi:hypothetical protein